MKYEFKQPNGTVKKNNKILNLLPFTNDTDRAKSPLSV